MAVKVTINMPALPKGKAITVNGLGTLKNGVPVTLSAEQEAAYRRKNGVSVEEGLKAHPRYKVEKTGYQRKGVND